jgi:hypothetical protein
VTSRAAAVGVPARPKNARIFSVKLAAQRRRGDVDFGKPAPGKERIALLPDILEDQRFALREINRRAGIIAATLSHSVFVSGRLRRTEVGYRPNR